jgi:hypothetical protein
MTRRTYDLTPPPGSEPAPANVNLGYEEAAGTTTLPGASNKQLNYLTSLLQERDLGEEARDALSKRVAVQILINEEHGDCSPPLAAPGLTKRRATEFIGRLLEQPKRPRELPKREGAARDIVGEHHDKTLPTPDQVPAGYYAVKNNQGELRFYKLWRGDRNPNYVKLYVQHSDDFTLVQPFPAAKTIIRQIAADPAAAARLYGRHLKHCSRCNRTLTNRISRLLDIGPVCGGHFYDEEIWNRIRASARAALEAAGLDPDADVEDTDDLDAIREAAGL